MFGFVIYEFNFIIIREEFKLNKFKLCVFCNQFGYEVKDCEGLLREKKGKVRVLRQILFYLKNLLLWENMYIVIKYIILIILKCVINYQVYLNYFIKIFYRNVVFEIM